MIHDAGRSRTNVTRNEALGTMVPSYDVCRYDERRGVSHQLLQKVFTISDLRTLGTPATHPLMGSQLVV